MGVLPGHIQLNSILTLETTKKQPDNYLIQINASNFIGGEDSAMFRLRFDGRYYFWMVDDMQLVVPAIQSHGIHPL